VKRIIGSMRCKEGLGTIQANKQEMEITEQSGLEAVAVRWQKKLEKFIVYVSWNKRKTQHCKAPKAADVEVSDDCPDIERVKSIDDDRRKAVCGQIAPMWKDDDMLNDDAQQVIARWLVRNLRPEDNKEDE